MIRSKVLASTIAVLGFLAACSDVTAPSAQVANVPQFAKGGGGGGGGGVGTPLAARCAKVTVLNNAPKVKSRVMPTIQYTLANCGSSAITVTVTVAEYEGFLSFLCPSPVAAAEQSLLAVGQTKVVGAPVYRGPCGMTGPVNGVLVQGENAWQGHNLRLTVTDDSNAAVLSVGTFNWQDLYKPGV